MGILGIVSLVASLIGTILQNRGVIGQSTDTLITSLVNSAGTLFASLKAGQSPVQDTLAVLGALSGVITTLKGTTNIPPATLTAINALDQDVQAALAAFVQSGKGIDLSVLTPIAPVV